MPTPIEIGPTELGQIVEVLPKATVNCGSSFGRAGATRVPFALAQSEGTGNEPIGRGVPRRRHCHSCRRRTLHSLAPLRTGASRRVPRQRGRTVDPTRCRIGPCDRGRSSKLPVGCVDLRATRWRIAGARACSQHHPGSRERSVCIPCGAEHRRGRDALPRHHCADVAHRATSRTATTAITRTASRRQASLRVGSQWHWGSAMAPCA